ncbi:MAG: hypothetical protein H0W70_05270 [Actinobacteria bacterium]|nr:hypothetical protein [Actinomycetota bacterium]
MTLIERLVAVHEALNQSNTPHAFGGAIALAYCTQEPRGTRDIDVNVFVDVAEAKAVLDALPEGVVIDEANREQIRRGGQTRLTWGDTPLDLFFNVDDFHREVAARTRTVPFARTSIPILDCATLTVFKAMFSRPKDWVDIATMLECDTIDATFALGWITRLVGHDHESTRRLAELIRDAAT